MADNISIKDATGTTKTVATHELTTDTAHASKVVIADTNERLAGIDASTWSLQTVDYAHHEIHSGSRYSLCEQQDLNGTYYYSIITDNSTKWSHMLFDFSCEGEMLVEVYEGGTANTGGTGLTPRNKNRNIADGALTSITSGVNGGGVDGSKIFEARSGVTGSGNNTSSSANTSSRDEWVLKQNTEYTIALTTATSLWINVHFDWYEHVNKEVI